MRTLKIGEVYALDRRAGLDVQIETMTKKFRRKHGYDPLNVVYNPVRYKDEKATVKITRDKTIQEDTVWMECRDKD